MMSFDDAVEKFKEQLGMPSEDSDILCYALASIASESAEVESVRIAMVALYETATGRAFLSANPMKI